MAPETGYYLLTALAWLSWSSSDAYGVLLISRAGGLGFLFLHQVAYSVTLALVAYPAGGMADRWGRRRALAVGYALLGLNYVTLAVRVNFLTNLLTSVVAAVGLALAGGSMSGGALEAWVAGELSGARAKLRRVISRGEAVGFVSAVLAGALGSGANLLFGLRAPLFISGALGLVAGLVAWLILRESYGERRALGDVLRGGFRYAWTCPAVLWTGLGSLLVFSASQAFGLVGPVLLVNHGVPDAALGILGSVGYVASSAGSLGSEQLVARAGIRLTLLSGISAWAVAWAVFALGKGPWSVGFFLLAALAWGILSPAQRLWRNSIVPGPLRATMLGVLNMMSFLGSGILMATLVPRAQELGAARVALMASAFAAAGLGPFRAAFRSLGDAYVPTEQG